MVYTQDIVVRTTLSSCAIHTPRVWCTANLKLKIKVRGVSHNMDNVPNTAIQVQNHFSHTNGAHHAIRYQLCLLYRQNL